MFFETKNGGLYVFQKMYVFQKTFPLGVDLSKTAFFNGYGSKKTTKTTSFGLCFYFTNRVF